MRELRNWTCFLSVVTIAALSAHGQIDPVKRQLFQFGYNQLLEGRAPLAAYAFYYRNQPNFLRTSLTLRLAVAPVYLDSELGLTGALVRKLLHQLGCSVQRPTTRLVQADPRKQNKWIRYTYPNLKKTPEPKAR